MYSMEIASIKPDFEFRIKPSRAKTFLIPVTNGGRGIDNFISATAAQFQVSNVEMVTFEPTPYTSLKDLIQTSPPPSSIMSPNNSRKDSWREIPIKDPLLQHAAWAYLQPMSTDTDGPHNRKLMHKLMDHWRGVFGCFNDVVLLLLKNFFSFSFSFSLSISTSTSKGIKKWREDKS